MRAQIGLGISEPLGDGMLDLLNWSIVRSIDAQDGGVDLAVKILRLNDVAGVRGGTGNGQGPFDIADACRELWTSG